MSEPITASEAKQIMDAIQALTLEVKVNQAKNDEQFRALNEKVDALRSELRDDVNELRTQQRSTDGRLWAFIVGLVTLVGSGVIKVLWFDRP